MPRTRCAGQKCEILSIRDHLDKQEGGFTGNFELIAHPLDTGWRTPSVLVAWDALMREYRQTKQFKSYVRESGIHDYWQQAGYPPQCRPLGDDDFECESIFSPEADRQQPRLHFVLHGRIHHGQRVMFEEFAVEGHSWLPESWPSPPPWPVD